MAKNAKILCPLNQKECIEDGKINRDNNGKVILDKDGEPEMVACRFWVTVIGKHPQTGEQVNNADCAFCWTPVLMIENSKVNRETGAAVESFRNEMVKSNDSAQNLLLQALATTNQQPTVTLIESKN
jgi:hypothetical protein